MSYRIFIRTPACVSLDNFFEVFFEHPAFENTLNWGIFECLSLFIQNTLSLLPYSDPLGSSFFFPNWDMFVFYMFIKSMKGY